jgi:hypothetical protein
MRKHRYTQEQTKQNKRPQVYINLAMVINNLYKKINDTIIQYEQWIQQQKQDGSETDNYIMIIDVSLTEF